MRQEHDAIVIGAGFAGMAAALAFARTTRPILIVDAGAPRNRFSPHSHGVPGFDGASPAMIRAAGMADILSYPNAMLAEAEVREAAPEGDGFRVTLSDGNRHRARRLLLATGQSDTLPALPGLAERWGQTAVHCPYCHGYELRGRRLGVLNLHERSAHQAALVADLGPVTFFTQGNALAEADAALLARKGIAVERRPVAALLGPAPELEAVRLEDGTELDLGGIFLPLAAQGVGPLPHMLGCALAEGPFGPAIAVDGTGATSVKGVFAAGDVAGQMVNALIALASGAKAGAAMHGSLALE